MLGYDVEIFEANGEKTISTSYPNIYILLKSSSSLCSSGSHNNDLYKHFKMLNPMQQEIIKQTMQLKYLELNSNN